MKIRIALSLVLAFLCAPLLAADTRVDNMVAQCAVVMQADVCKVALDPRDYPNPTILFSGVGRVKTASYLRIRGAGTARDTDGSYRMCTMVREVCTSQWDGDDCRAARALWRQAAP